MVPTIFRRTRQDLGLSQAALARSCRVSQAAISRIERQNLKPSPRLKNRIAGILNLPVEVLFRHEESALEIPPGR